MNYFILMNFLLVELIVIKSKLDYFRLVYLYIIIYYLI